MGDLKLTLVTPTKKLVTDLPIEQIQVPGFRGELDILANHAPLVTTLSTGLLSYKPKESSISKKVAVSWGYMEVYENQVTVLAETAETPEEIDVQRAHIALESSLEAMKSAEELEKYRLKAERARLRIELAKNQSGTTAH